ncbi:hypothetical protein B0T21DRAFT_348106 [Apiosordaria backusii]|uniref:Uncharacterized protein n=1 Tax=Apiosordaria backusii TaxID=314023 RepID=A0AA40EFW5_9PEZI|nr:hypothetical protein B0T21DRAFT_348106 [Apiosordaria backusii]
MARTKQIEKRSERGVITWTRFHLPVDQEWPTWAVDHENVHFGPLIDVEGMRKAWLGRMVDNPEQAAYIIEWSALGCLEIFQSSAACLEFLQNLPQIKSSNLKSPSESSSPSPAGNILPLEGASSSSSPPASALSRFLTLLESTQKPKSDVEGRVTLNAFLVPGKRDDESTRKAYQALRAELCSFQPRGFEFIKGSGLHWQWHKTTWFWTIEEDKWARSKFGELEKTGENIQHRTIICDFHLWPRKFGATPKHEEAAAADPEAKQSWNDAVSKVMPPVTAWVQERWDIVRVPYYEPPYEPTEEELEHQRELDEFIEYHNENPEPETHS